METVSTIVPNKFPTFASPSRLAIIGEAPGAEEVRLGAPFVGASGRFLATLLSRAGIAKDACFLGNVSQHNPPKNDISLFAWNGVEIQHGLWRLRDDLEKFKPHCTVLLGNSALKAAVEVGTVKPCKQRIINWRGSVFQCTDPASPLNGLKCIPSFHPAFCLRDYDATPFLQLDLRKAVKQSMFPEVRMIPRSYVIPREVNEALGYIASLRRARKKMSFDIEGWWNRISCIGFCNDITKAIIIPFLKQDGTHYWKDYEECRIWRAVAYLLEDPEVPKVAQAGLYDRFCLHYGSRIRVHGITDDTMTKHWAIYSELAKDVEKKKGKKGMGLAVQASIYTDMPYYKDERGVDDDDTFYRYCGKDCVITLEVSEVIDKIFAFSGNGASFTPAELATMKGQYHFNMDVTNALLYMSLRGIRYDSAMAEQRRKELQRKLYEEQARLNALTGYGFKWTSHKEIRDHIYATIMTKKGDRPYKDKEVAFMRLGELMRKPNPDLATMGEIEDLCEVSLNTDSIKQFMPFLYETLQLPVQFTEKKGEEPRPTADYEALIKLSRHCIREQLGYALSIIQSAITIRALSTRQQMLSILCDRDYRIRCAYNIVGSNTGRITCYESPTGSGYNLQTIPNYTELGEAPGGVLGDRDLFLADEGYYFFQCDLAGADGWTVAAYSAMLGDDTMLLDYRAGLRPFEVLVLKVLGVPIPKDRHDIYAECKRSVKKDSWERFAMKRVQHGGCYLEGELTISRNILKDSEGKMYLPPSECKLLKKYFFDRYWGVDKWHSWVANRLKARPVLQAASGQVRLFFGRPDEVLTKAVAFEPQANTTYATNLAMHRLWTDNDNRQGEQTGDVRPSDIRLRIEPLHQVHDALCGQFRKLDTAWATGKIKSYFNNVIKIAGLDILIPYDGGYGPSWGKLDVGKL